MSCAPEAITLSPDLVDFVEGGCSIILGSCDANRRPECARGLGVVVAGDRRSLTVFVNAEVTTRMQADFTDNGRIAVGFSRIRDHRSVQLKGRVTHARPATADEVMRQRQYLAAFAEALSYAGLARSIVLGLRVEPSLAVEVVVDEVFDQTPGAGAGARISSP